MSLYIIKSSIIIVILSAYLKQISLSVFIDNKALALRSSG
jgi:hypothetical protein